jgi:hypothetical protein
VGSPPDLVGDDIYISNDMGLRCYEIGSETDKLIGYTTPTAGIPSTKFSSFTITYKVMRAIREYLRQEDARKASREVKV